jgi:hypothetical protein
MKLDPIILKNLQIIYTLKISPRLLRYFPTLKRKDFLNSTSFRFSKISRSEWASENLFCKKVSDYQNSQQFFLHSIIQKVPKLLKYAKYLNIRQLHLFYKKYFGLLKNFGILWT